MIKRKGRKGRRSVHTKPQMKRNGAECKCTCIGQQYDEKRKKENL
jgi:hypothetical protein